jgi:hypothetical protein
VRCIPTSDISLRQRALAALDAVEGHVAGEEIERILRAALSERYPLVDIRRQADLARVADDEVWYVYRDGRPSATIAPSQETEPLANPIAAGGRPLD